jgi:putative DNA primase/helicase
MTLDKLKQDQQAETLIKDGTNLLESNEAAIEFLRRLDPTESGTFNIEQYSDSPKGAVKPKPDPLIARYPNLTLGDVKLLLPQLTLANAKGAGIFIARNQCDGHRSEKNVIRVRGVHADMDDVSASELAAVLARLEPTIVVQSSTSNRCQLYWQLADDEEMSKDEAKLINQGIAKIHGADPAAVDVSRLLRLPGFKHMKYRAEGKTPFVKVLSYGPIYKAQEIRDAFPPPPEIPSGSDTRRKTKLKEKPTPRPLPINLESGNDSSIPMQLEHIAEIISEKYPSLWTGNWSGANRSSGGMGYSSKSEADLALAGHIARVCAYQGVEKNELHDAVEILFNGSKMGAHEKWRSRSDYRANTISKAVNSLDDEAFAFPYSALQLESHGDIRNARAFAQVARGQFLYVATRQSWLKWCQEQWQLCEKEEHIAAAKAVCTQILSAATVAFRENQETGKKLMQDAMSAHTLTKIMAMLKLSVSEPQMATTDRELDSDPYILGVQNGIIDLRSGQHLFNQPDFLVTRYCNASYEEDATCPQWLTFLDQIFQSDLQTIESVQRLLGCSLLGLGTEEKLIICYGHGSNGKSVFNNVIYKILGGYALTAPPSILTARRKDDTGPRNDLAALAGKRYVSINETQAGDRLDEQTVKIMAGREPITARFLNQEFFVFDPSFTPWLRTNHKPIITGEDDGIWRRLVLIPFKRKFTDVEKDNQLEQKLLSESNGILMWMVEGAKLYQETGICLSPRMTNEIATYRKESDLLGEFLADYTTQDPTCRVNQATLYKEYRDWTETCGVRALAKKSFTQRLAERNHPEGKSGNARYYVGLKLGQSETRENKPTQGVVGGIIDDLPITENLETRTQRLENSEQPAQVAQANYEEGAAQ